MDAAIDAAFSKVWTVGGAERHCRYRFKNGVHTLKTTSPTYDVLPKDTVCINQNGDKFEVVNSIQLLATTFEHTIQVLNDEPSHDWTPKR